MSHQMYNQIEDIEILEDENVIQLRIYDFKQHYSTEMEIPSGRSHLYYYLNYDLSLKAIGTSDGYDVSADILYKNGLIDQVADYRYFEEYKKELR